MNRKLLVTLLQKSIQELEMITEGFLEMDHYPKAIILLAQRKTDDIQSYIEILSTVLPDSLDIENENETAIIDQNEEGMLKEEPKEVAEKEVTEVKEDKEDSEEIEEEEEIEDEEEDTEEIESEITEKEELTTTTAVETNEQEVLEEKFTSNETITVVEESIKSASGDKNSVTTVTRNELLSKTENTISSTLGNKKITDIKQGVNIGDRFRFQRELFRGNGEDMNKTLTYLNQLATLDEALSFLRSKYGWATDNETAEDFYQIVRRRFL